MKAVEVDIAVRDRILAPYVKAICTVDLQKDARSSVLRYFADGMPGMIIQHSNEPIMLNGSRRLAPIYLYGQTVEPITLSSAGRSLMTIVFFYPDVVQQLFRVPAHELMDSCVDLNLLPLKSKQLTSQQLTDAKSEQERIDIVKEFILQLIIARDFPFDRELRYATEVLNDPFGTKKIGELARELRISERTITRRFERNVGVAPKLFSNICRFQSAIKSIEQDQVASFAGLAMDLGYADQSHFNRAFKRFTGMTPIEFTRSRS